MFRVYCVDRAGHRFMREFATEAAAVRFANSPSVMRAVIVGDRP